MSDNGSASIGGASYSTGGASSVDNSDAAALAVMEDHGCARARVRPAGGHHALCQR